MLRVGLVLFGLWRNWTLQINWKKKSESFKYLIKLGIAWNPASEYIPLVCQVVSLRLDSLGSTDLHGLLSKN